MKSGDTPAVAAGYRFGGFVLDPRRRQLRRADGGEVALTAKAFDVLCVLVREHERVVSRDELFAEVWPGRVVEENTLTQAVSALRHALGTGLRYVATVPGRGYRFVADVEELSAPATPAVPASAPATPPAARPWRPWPALLAAAVGLGLLLVLAWPRGGSQAPGPSPQAGPAAPPRTLAVLPFRSEAAAADDPWLGEGLAEGLGLRLAGVPGLRLFPAPSSRQLAGLGPDPLQAARGLGVDYLVQGGIRPHQDGWAVELQLRAADDGRQLWAGRYLLAGAQPAAPPAHVVQGLAAALGLVPAGGRRSACDGEDPEAYRAWLRGQYQMGRPSPERARRAVAQFQQALERDPACARAYAGLAYAYRALAVVADAEPRVVFPLAQAAVDRALALDPELAEAHVARGWIQLWYDWDWDGAEAAFRRALELDPGLAEAHFGLGNLYMHTGRMEQAREAMRQALALDPLSPLFNAIGGWAIAHAGQPNQHLDRALELDPDYFLARIMRAVARQRGGDAQGALADLEQARRLCDDCSHALVVLASVHLRQGHPQAVRALLRQMEQRRGAGYWPASSLAALHLGLGQTGTALDLLEQARDERDTRIAFLQLDRQSRWAPLEREPRFQALLAQLRLPQLSAGPAAAATGPATRSEADRNSR